MSVTEATPLTRTVDGVEVPTPGTYTIDPSHSHAGFVVRHLMVSKVRGSFSGVTGTVEVADDVAASSVTVEIDPTTVDTRDEGRDEHLRSGDFFGTDEHPTITYNSTGLRKDGTDWVLDGDLTIRGITNPVRLDVEFLGGATDPWGGARLGFTAAGEVDREAFGITWNQTLESGGVLVGKKVNLEIEVELVRA
jgi:polyisoprenoid-binding protein YceI